MATSYRNCISPAFGHGLTFSQHVSSPSSRTPPELSCSKSSVSSPFYSSYQSDENTLSYIGNFEEIGLDDDDDELRIGPEDKDYSVKPMTGYLDTRYAPNSRNAKKTRSPSIAIPSGNRELIKGKRINNCPKVKPKVTSYPHSLRPEMSPSNTMRLNVSPVSLPAQFIRRDRVSSPNVTNIRNSGFICLSHPRRSVWQTKRDRKTVKELEKECDEEDGDDVPDDCFLDNVPISSWPASQQPQYHSKSITTSPERQIKRNIKSFGNGTSAQPAEQGELRSPIWAKSQDSTGKLSSSGKQSNTRAMSWSTAMYDLSLETKRLTKALEEYERKICDSGSIPYVRGEKLRVKSAFAELPPLRRTEMMIDPLPISKEKEAVLSRTRPSWLPPKDPAEEKRHIKEYQKMMANFLEANRKSVVISEGC